LIVASVAGLLLAGSVAFVLVRGDDLRTRLAMVSEGMTRAQVVAILGRPEVTLQRARPEDGQVLLWVDQLWQVEVVVDGGGKVIKTSCTRSNSLYWRTVGRLTDLPK